MGFTWLWVKIVKTDRLDVLFDTLNTLHVEYLPLNTCLFHTSMSRFCPMFFQVFSFSQHILIAFLCGSWAFASKIFSTDLSQDVPDPPRNRKRSRTMRFSIGPGNLHLKINEACPWKGPTLGWVGKMPWRLWRFKALSCTKEGQTDDSMLQRFVVGPQNNLQSLGTSLGNDQSRSILKQIHLFSMEIHGKFQVSMEFSMGFPFCNDCAMCVIRKGSMASKVGMVHYGLHPHHVGYVWLPRGLAGISRHIVRQHCPTTLWWTYKKQWKITIFNGKIHDFYGHFPLLC